MARAKVRAPRSPLAQLFDALVVLAGMWLAGGLAAAAGWAPWLRWLAAALVFPVVPLALLILVSPRLGLQRVAVGITFAGVVACALGWRAGLVAAVTTHASWPLGTTEPATTAPPAAKPTPTTVPTPIPPTRPTPQPTVADPRPPDDPPPQPTAKPDPPAAPKGSRCFRDASKNAHSDSAYGTILADMDGDARLDAVAIESTDAVAIRVWKGDRDGRFTAATTQPYDGGGLHLAVLDVDRDGKLDVATSDHEQATVTLWMGAGDGSLKRGASQKTYRSPLGVLAADLDVDGFSDLVVAHYFHVEVMRGGKGGKLRSTPWLRLEKQADKPETLLTPEDIAAADLTGDGLLDLVIPKGDVTSIEVWTGRGRGSLRRAATITSCYAPSAALVGDVVEDRAADVVVHCGGAGHFELFVGDGKGGLEGRGQIGPDHALGGGALADLTGDGHLDLISPVVPGGLDAHMFDTRGGVLMVHAGDGKGNFHEVDARALDGIQHRVVAVVDIDGDEHLDVVHQCYGQSPGGHLGVAFGTGCAAND